MKYFLPDPSSTSVMKTKVKDVKILQGQYGLSEKHIATVPFFIATLYNVVP